jgi:tripartite ATP-independent transporter DctM subunit
VLLAVPFFLLAANLMNAAGITDRLIRMARALVGHLPGGLGHVNVVVSMFFAGISGSSTADAAGIGSLLIPQMKKGGFHVRPSPSPITACSSVMGVIIPPSILMVVWGGLMSVSIGGLFLAGVIPGILIAANPDDRRSTSMPSRHGYGPDLRPQRRSSNSPARPSPVPSSP